MIRLTVGLIMALISLGMINASLNVGELIHGVVVSVLGLLIMWFGVKSIERFRKTRKIRRQI